MTVRSFGRYSLIVALGLALAIGLSLAAASVSRAQTPTPNLFVTTTAVVDDPNDGKCDLVGSVASGLSSKLRPVAHVS